MHNLPKLAAAWLALATVIAPAVGAQEAAPVFAVTYIEVVPSATEHAIDLLREQARASRSERGNVRFQILQRSGRPNHFAMLDAWDSQEARDRNSAATHTRAFRDALEPLLYAPYDERPSTPVMGTAGAGGEGEVYVITHVDIIPTAVDEGRALVQSLVDASRGEPGAVDIGVLEQNSRRNHLTLFEIWSSAEHRIAHTATAHARHFRGEMLSRSGSLYDERLYRRL
jgi:quinol monooxygenase YgiN